MIEIVAEIGVNHNGNLRTAMKLISSAAEAGASTCKFQVFSPALSFDGDVQLLKTLQATQLGPKDLEDLRDECSRVGVAFLCSAFDRPSIDLLVQMGETRVKVPSSRSTVAPYLEYLVNQPFFSVIFATGACDYDDLINARCVFQSRHYVEVECVSAYPCDPRSFVLPNTRSVVWPFGLSDHSSSWEACIAAVARGACYIEKHFTLSYDQEGPDHKASLLPATFKEMVGEIRNVEAMLLNMRKKPLEVELGTMMRNRRHDTIQYRG